MLRNPYLNRSMIRSVDEFYGRSESLERTAARIGAPTPQSISLVGERRAGKSSLLWHLAQPEIHSRLLDEPERYVFLMMDFQGQQHLDQPGFCRVFGEQLSEVAALDLPELANLSDLQSAVRKLNQTDRRLICLFDEFEMITRNAEFSAPFFGFLRSLANTHPVAFVTASRRPLEALCHNEEIAESPFFNIFTQIHVGPMPAGEIQQLIAEPSETAGLPLAPHAETITKLAGHLPFYVQIACSAAFDHLSHNEGSFDKRAVERRFAEETNSHFRYIWDRLEEVEANAVAAIISGTPLDENQREALDDLLNDGYIIARGEGYQLFSTAFVRFLRKNAAEAIPRTKETPEQKTEAPKSQRRKLITAGVLVLIATAIAIYFAPIADLSAPASDTPAPAVATTAVEALQLSLSLPNSPDAIAFWAGLGVALVGLALALGYTVTKRRTQRRAEQSLMRELENELQTAREMQMGLMPTASPQIDGFNLTGRCIPASQVGGDFFQYFQQDGKLSICLADVTGHAMQAAVPVMIFSGVLKTEMGYGYSVEQLFSKLNRTMHQSLDKRTFVCFAMIDLDLTNHHLQFANSGCPYPFHYHASTGDVTELQIDAYPLGVRAETAYKTIETSLETGDYIVFCSDGIIEAANTDEGVFGFEQTVEAIRVGCAEGLSAEALIDRLIGAVQAFAGDEPQRDDMTCVVLRVEEA